MDELLGANTDTLDRMAESLALDARTLQDIRTRGRQVVEEIDAAWNGPDPWHLIQQWEQQGLPQLAAASTSLETCASQLRAQSTGQQPRRQQLGFGLHVVGTRRRPRHPVPASPGGRSSTEAPTRTPRAGSPPEHGSPGENASWWKSLSEQERRRVIREHPERLMGPRGRDRGRRGRSTRLREPNGDRERPE
jgi:uncharacterized protein YukE